MTLIIILLATLMAASFMFSGAETLFFSFSELEIRKAAKSKHPAARIISNLSKNRSGFLTFLLFANTIVNIAFVSLANLFFERVGYGGSEYSLVKVLVIALILLMFCEITPKALALASKRIFIYILFPAFFLFYLFYPFVFMFEKIFKKRKKRKRKTRSGIKDILTYLKENEEHVRDEVEFLEKYTDLKNKEILSISVKKEGIIYLKSGATAKQAGVLFKKYRLSRIPIVSNDIDTIIGIFYVKDIIHMREDETVERRMRKPHKINFSAPVFKVMNYFLKNKTHMAVLVDSMGKTLGLVTLQDIINDIVKPLQEED
ncbi:MAG: CNNM domain-containing protein [bacterium]|nr:CNNM domain-containing protein [bacterium]